MLERQLQSLACSSRVCVFAVLSLPLPGLYIQAVIGGLVAKTLTTSSTNPYAQGGAGARAAPVALDVFSVQVSKRATASGLPASCSALSAVQHDVVLDRLVLAMCLSACHIDICPALQLHRHLPSFTIMN